MAEYDVAKIQEKNTAKDRKNMSAQELAVLSNVYGIEKVSTFDQSQDSTQEDIRNVNDISTKSQKAGWNSALDFLSGLFIWRDKIDFTVNGTRFTGRDGYQVRGGAVPVFDGVVVDFLPATLKGDFTDNSTMMAGGNNAQLVVYPRNMDTMFSVKLDDNVTIGIDEGSPFIIGESKENISITQNQENGKQVSIHADGVMLKKITDTDFQDTRLELIEPVVDNPEETREVEDVSITSAGVVISYQEKPEEKSEEVREQDKEETKEETKEEIKEETDKEVQEQVQEETDRFSLSNSFDILGKGDDEEEEEDKEKEEEEEEESALEKIKAFWGDDAKWAKIDFVKKALIEYFTTGKVPSPEKNPFGDLSGVDKEGETDISVKFPILPGLNFKVGFEPGYEIKLSGTYFVEDAENSAITIKGLAENIEKLFNEKKADKENTGNTENKADNRELARIIDMAEGLKLKLGGGLKVDGSLALKFTAGLQADASYLFQADANLYAEGKLQGRKDTGLAAAKLSTTIGIENGKLAVGDKVDLNLEAGLSFNAGVGTEGKIVSRLFSWEKELWSKEFASVSIFEVNMNSQLSAPTGEGISGFKMVKSGIGFKTMSGKMKQNNWDNLKLRMNDPSPVVNMLTKGADAQIKDMDSLIQEYEELKKNTLYMDDSRSLSKQEGEESFHNMKEHFLHFTESLETRLKLAKNTLDNMQSAINNMLKADAYQSNMKKTEKNIKKHEERLNQMQEWAKSLKNGEEDVTAMRDSQAFDKYQEITGSSGAGMVSASKKDIKQQAKQNVATRENLLRYEKRRQREILQDKEKLMQELNAQLDTSQTDKNNNDPDFVKFYFKKAKGSNLRNQLSLYYRDKESLLEYEKARLKETAGKHINRKFAVESYARRAKKENFRTVDRETIKYYEETLGGKEMMQHLADVKATSKGIIEYEMRKITDNPDSRIYYERIQDLEEYKKRFIAASDKSKNNTETPEEVLQKARNYFFSREDMNDVFEHSYRMATADDLITYEKNWKPKKNTVKDRKVKNANNKIEGIGEVIFADSQSGIIESEENTNKLVNSLSDEGREELNRMIREKKIGMKGLSRDIRQNIGETIRNNVSLETLLQYQQNLKNKDGNTEKKIKCLESWIDQAKSISELSMRQDLIGDIRKQYFSGQLWKTLLNEDDSSIQKEHQSLISQIKGQEINDIFVLYQMWLDEYDKYAGSHDARAKELTKLKEKGLGDMQIWDSYKAMGAGNRFKQEWKMTHTDPKLNDITIDQMILYEKRKLRKETRQGWIKQQIDKFKNGDEGYLQAKGGHYQRLLSMMEWRDQELNKGETPEEHEKELIRRYKEELNAGGGYESFLEENKYEMVTYDDIIKYEEGKIREKGGKHQDRIEYIKNLGNNLTYEQMLKYRNMAMSDGESTKDKINNVVSQIYSGYSTGYDNSLKAEEVLTPQMILEYEERQKAEIRQKHDERIRLLENQEISDDELWEKYQQMGGGKRFAKVNKAEISQESEEVTQNFYNYDNITAYEERRLQHYNTIKKSIDEPINKMQGKAAELQKKMEELQGIQDKINQVTPETFFLGNNALDKPVSDLGQKSTESKDIVGSTEQYGTEIQKKVSEQINELDDYLNEEDVEELLES